MPDDDRPGLVPRRMLDLCRDTLRRALVRIIRQERTIRRLRAEVTRLRGILREHRGRRGMAMTDPVTGKELGSDEQMGDDRLEAIQRRLDLELAAIAEEERKTRTRPQTGPG